MSIRRQLEALGYHPRWLEAGLIGAEFVAEQHERLQEDDAANPEHYRWEAFRRLTGRSVALAAGELAAYLEVARLEPDQALRRAALCELVAAVPPHLLSELVQLAEYQVDPMAKALRLRQLSCDLRGSERERAILDILKLREGAAHELLLELDQLDVRALEELAAHGATRRVRNVAADRLRRRHR